MADSDEGRDPATVERYRRDLDQNVVAIVVDEGLVVLRLSFPHVAQSPTFDAEGGLTQDADVRVADFHSESLEHVGLIVLNRLEAPP